MVDLYNLYGKVKMWVKYLKTFTVWVVAVLCQEMEMVLFTFSGRSRVGSNCVCAQYSGRVRIWSPAVRLNLVAGGTTQYFGHVRIRSQAVRLNTLVIYESGRRRYDSILSSYTTREKPHVHGVHTTDNGIDTTNHKWEQDAEFWGYGEGTLFEERGGNVWSFNETINDDGVRMNLVRKR